MVWTFIALVMTVLMGGIIAYTGDLIGRRFGKKRVTIFGLRPRYTAILITSVTGVAISAITTGILFLLVPTVRDVILRGEQAILENKSYDFKNRSLESRNAALKAQNAQYSRQVDETRKELAPLLAEQKRLQSLVDSTKERLTGVSDQLVQQKALLATSQAKVAALNVKSAALVAKNDRLTSANSALAEANIKLTGSNEKLQQDNTTLVSQNAVLGRQNGELAHEYDDRSKRNVELVRQNRELEKQNGDLEHQRTILTRIADKLRDDANDQKQKNDRLVADNTRLSVANARLTSENTELKRIAPGYNSVLEAYGAARNKRVAIHKDEDLARIVIPADCDPSVVRSYIQSLLSTTSDIAKSRGAAPGQGVRAVEVVSKEFFARMPNGQVKSVQVTGDERIDGVVAKLAWQTNPCAVLAIAVANSVEDEPAAIDLQPYPNKRVFTKGQVVQWRYVNGLQPMNGIYEEVAKFLKEMGQYSLEHGVIPRMDPMTGEPEVGLMSFPDILNIMKRVSDVGGRVRIRAIAEKDIFSADPLKVKFEVTQ